MSEELPSDIREILEFLAMKARGYENRLKWNEVACLKADLMRNRRYWMGFSPDTVRIKARALGMRAEDAQLIAGLVDKAQAGRRLVPQRSYADFEFVHDRPRGREGLGGSAMPLRTSREW